VIAARRQWDRGDYIDVGRLLYERLPAHERPLWAVAALAAVCDVAGSIPEIDDLIVLAHFRERWPEARQAFDALRQLTLTAAREGDMEGRRGALLGLAENVAKVIYNASGSPAAYDHNAGWKVVSCLGEVLDELGDAARREDAWQAITTS